MTLQEIIQFLENNKDEEKIRKQIQDAWNSNLDEFFIGIQLNLDNNEINKQIKIPKIQYDDGFMGDFHFKDFERLYSQLLSDKFTDSEKKILVDEAALSANILEWNLWYRRILMKSLGKFWKLDLIIDEIQKIIEAK